MAQDKQKAFDIQALSAAAGGQGPAPAGDAAAPLPAGASTTPATPPPLPSSETARPAGGTPPPLPAAGLPPPGGAIAAVAAAQAAQPAAASGASRPPAAQAQPPRPAPPPPLPPVRPAPPPAADEKAPTGGTRAASSGTSSSTEEAFDDEDEETTPSARRVSRRRPAGPVRNRIAANDDAPSIGGLIYALNEKPSSQPFRYAAIASAVWAVLGVAFVWIQFGTELSKGAGFVEILARPTTFLVFAAVVVPIAVLWLLALLAWRAEELRLRSSTMTEVAVRLAEPDRMAEQQIASLGQAVRRQVGFMNDAVSRALGRAGELEALVHNEVAALERSYEDNERKIRSLIQELSGERQALLTTGDRVSDTLRTLGEEVPAIIERLSSQQLKLAHIIQGAGDNLTSLESAINQSTGRLEGQLGERTHHLQSVLEDYTRTLRDTIGNRTGEMQAVLGEYTEVLATALGQRTDEMRGLLDTHTQTIGTTLSDRTGEMQVLLESYTGALATALSSRAERMETVFEEYSRALDSTLTNRAQAIDTQLIERTRALDRAFDERLRLFDEALVRSTQAIDSAVDERARALTTALDTHARTFNETIAKQTNEIDESLLRGISAVRRSSENITRQSLKAIEGLAGQSDLLKNVSENLLAQIGTVTTRFETQGQSIMRAANALETANYKIDSTLQARHQDLSETLDRLSGKANEFGKVLADYSTSIEGTMTDAELRARRVADELKSGAERRKQIALEDLSRLKSEADAESERTLNELRQRFSSVSSEVSRQLGSLTSRFDETSAEVRQQAERTAAEIANEQMRLRQQLDQLPRATRESADAMRRALQDQLAALDQLSTLTTRSAQARDVAPPMPGIPPSGDAGGGRQLTTLSQTLAQELTGRARTPLSSAAPPAAPAPGPIAGAAAAGPSRGEPRDGWSLGDLLARASLDEEHGGGQRTVSHPPVGAPGGLQPQAGLPAPSQAMPAALPVPVQAHTPFALDVDVMARALDPATASAIWSRFRTGQRGIMVRSIYTGEGRSVFDEVSRRYKTDPDLQATVQRYLGEFERILRDADQRDPSGRLTQGHLVSDTGRVYLFLAHASGRLV